MKIGEEEEPYVTEPVKDPFEVEREAPAPVERPDPETVPERVPA